MPNRNIYCTRTLFNVDLKRRNCPSARCASADIAINRNDGVLSGKYVLPNDFLNKLC